MSIQKDSNLAKILADALADNSRQQSKPAAAEEKKADRPLVRPTLGDVLTRGAMSSRAFRSALQSSRTASGGSLRTRMSVFYGVSSNGSGAVYAAINVYSDATYGLINLGEFTNFLALFREFRLESIGLHFIPDTPYKAETGVNPNGRILVVNVDPDNDSTPASSLTQYQDSDARVFSNQMEKKWTVHNSDKRWFNTFSSSNPQQPLMAIKIAGDPSLGTSQTIGVLVIDYIVHFRARV